MLKPFLRTLIMLIGLSTVSAQAQKIYVNPCKEVEGPADGTEAHPYPTLTRAVAAAPEGRTVVVQGGKPPYPVTVAYPETGLFPPVGKRNLKIEAQDGSAQIGRPLGTQRLWQLTGETDLERQVDTPSQTVSRYGLRGTDLGASFEHDGRIYFLFGDTWPSFDPEGRDVLQIRPINSDSIAWIPANTDPERPVRLNFLAAPDGPRGTEGYYLPPTVVKPDGTTISRAEFEVPLNGFSANGKMYVFFSTDHIHRPPGPIDDYMGRSVLARLNDLGRTIGMFTYLYDASCLPGITCLLPDGRAKPAVGRFINLASVVVNNAETPELLQTLGPGQGVLLWGTGLYRESDPYLAYVPLNGVENPATWRYAVTDGAGHLVRWSEQESSEQESDATPLFVQNCGVLGTHCRMGEFSVTWNPFLRKWLMLYNHGNPPGINYRVADKPWGPWEGPYILFDSACDRGFCHFMHVGYDKTRCDNVADQPFTLNGVPTEQVWGDAYGPYVISRLTKGDATTTTIYWTMSTWNPYQVMLMKSTLRLSDARRVDHPQQPR